MDKQTLKLLLFCIFCWGYDSNAQGWERLIPTPDKKTIIPPMVLPTPDQGFLGIATNLGHPRFTYLYKFDQDGQLQWQKVSEGMGATFSTLDSNNQVVLVGEASSDISKSFKAIQKFNLSGELIQTLPIQSPPRGNHYRELIQSTDQTYFAVNRIKQFNEDSTDIIIIDHISASGEYIKEIKIDGFFFNLIFDAIPTVDSGLILTYGYSDIRPYNIKNLQFEIFKLSMSGEIIWRIPVNENLDLSPGISEDFIAHSGREIIHFDKYGNEIFSGIYNLPKQGLQENIINKIIPFKEGWLLFGKGRQTNRKDYDNNIVQLDASFQILEIYQLGRPFLEDFPGQILNIDDQSIVVAGAAGITGFTDFNFYIAKTDSLFRTNTNSIGGSIAYDMNMNCLIDESDLPLQNWYLKAKKENDLFYARTNENGHYQMTVDTGLYKVDVIRPNIYWEACDTNQIDQMDQFFDTIQIDHQMQVRYSCPLLKVDVSTPLLRRCFANTYTIQYCNEGTAIAEEAQLYVAFDSLLLIDSTSMPWVDRNGQVLQFDVGEVPIGACGQIKVHVTVDCENALLGQSHCVEARMFPDTLCSPPGIDWDGSSLEVSGQCLGDSLVLKIENVGQAMQASTQFIVTENDVVYHGGNVQLDSSEFLVIKTFANGNTFRLTVNQSSGHPGSSSPSVVIEGCGGPDQPQSLGYVINNPFDEGDPFVSIDCQENIGSWDPNDIQGFPRGQGPTHLIDTNQDLEYKIRFQNTGTDTAFNVVIRDTLPPGLQVTSVQPGASSHPYRFTINNRGILKFYFDHILLPDSNTNETASHGFVQYKVAQQPDLVPGTVLNNRAAIFFDFNEPVITNTAFHTIRKPRRFGIMENNSCDFEQVGVDMWTEIDTISFANYDSLHMEVYNVFPAQEIMLDTLSLLPDFTDQINRLTDGRFELVLGNQYGCDSILIADAIVTNIQEHPIDPWNLQVIPNPVLNHEIRLQFMLHKAHTIKVNLLNSIGQQVNTQPFEWNMYSGQQQKTIPLTYLPTGVYFLKITDSKTTILKKIVLAR